MKHLLFTLLLLLPTLCIAQKDPCRKIKREVSANGITIKAPELKYVSAVKEYKMGLLFGLYLRVTDHTDHEGRTGAVIEFDDGTKVTDEATQVYSQQSQSNIYGGPTAGLSQSGEYLLQGFFHITEQNVQKFITRKVVSICLGSAVQHIHPNDAARLRVFLKCMNDMGRE